MEEEAYGRITRYMLTCLLTLRKQCLLMNVGTTHTKKMMEMLEDPNQQALIHSITFDDCHFTVLGFTVATMVNVYAVLLLCKVFQVCYVMGVNAFAEAIGDESNFDENQDRLDRLLLLELSSEYHGQLIPCFENGVNTLGLLAYVCSFEGEQRKLLTFEQQ